MSLLSIIAINSRGVASYTPPSPSIVRAINSTIDNSVNYNGFPWPGALPDGTIVTVYKRSSFHAAAGSLMFAKSTDGGATWIRNVVSVGGNNITQCTNLSLNVHGSRIVVFWQDSAAPKTIRHAYSDNAGSTWTLGGTFVGTDANYTNYLFSKPQKLPSGKILQAYYSPPNDATIRPCIAGFIQSTDNGGTWTQGPIIASQMRKDPAESASAAIAAGRGSFSEVCLTITHPGATDATTKMVALLRNEDYSFFTHYYSSDGGATWTRNNTNPIVYIPDMVDPSYNRPVAPILYNGTMYIFCGNRVARDYGVDYNTISPDNFFANNATYSVKTRIYNAVATTNASDVDFGYPEPFIDAAGQLVIHFYDADPSYNLATTPDWEDIKQLVVISN